MVTKYIIYSRCLILQLLLLASTSIFSITPTINRYPSSYLHVHTISFIFPANNVIPINFPFIYSFRFYLT